MVAMIGILALQGGFAAHGAVLDTLGIAHRLVKKADDLDVLDGLILPGGESTAMLKLMDAYDLFEPLAAFGETGKPVLGTYAGAILMSSRILGRDQRSFGWIPATIDRNAYGSQRESFSQTLDCPHWGLKDVPALFIRAPRFTAIEPQVEVFSRSQEDITGVVFRQFTAVTYHPELGGDTRFHQAWYHAGVAAAQPV